MTWNPPPAPVDPWVSDWILADGYWDDNGDWDDTAVWLDAPPPLWNAPPESTGTWT